MKPISGVLFVLSLAGASAPVFAIGAEPAQAALPDRVPAALVDFFTGRWSGAGEFASGKKIEADVSFRLELEGQWLQYRHTDRAPNRYQALGMWGVDNVSHQLIMSVTDNFGGARVFGSGGWDGNSVSFVRTEAGRSERFVFERQSENSFKMRYEVRSGEQPWRLGDYLVFTRVPDPAAGAVASLAAPLPFAPGVISGPEHDAAPAFSADGRTLWFSRSDGGASTILESRYDNGQWSAPRTAGFSGRWRDMEPAMAPGGDYLVFISNRPVAADGKPLDGDFGGKHYAEGGGNLWRVERRGDGWGEPVHLPAIVNASSSTFAPSVARDGSLYFMHPSEDSGKFRLYRAQYRDGAYLAPVALPFSTGASTDVDPAVAPDESFIVFGSGRSPARGMDLFIAFRRCGEWGRPLHLGGRVNSAGSDAEPRLGIDGRTLYFSSERLAEDATGAAWNNGKYNIWQVALTPLLEASPPRACGSAEE